MTLLTIAELLKQKKAEGWITPYDVLRNYPERRFLHQMTGWGPEPRYTIWTLASKKDIQSWDRKALSNDAVEWDQLPSHWAPISFNRMTIWIEVEADDSAAGRRPCGLHGDCERPAVPDNPDHRCAMHAAADRKRTETNARYQEAWAAHIEHNDRARQVADQVAVEWNEVCDLLDIVHRGDDPSPSSPARVVVDSEVLSALLRQLRQILAD